MRVLSQIVNSQVQIPLHNKRGHGTGDETPLNANKPQMDPKGFSFFFFSRFERLVKLKHTGKAKEKVQTISFKDERLKLVASCCGNGGVGASVGPI